MRGMLTSSWNVGTEDFMLAIVIDQTGCGARVETIVSKKNSNHPTLKIDLTGANKDFIFTTGGSTKTFTGAASGGRSIITCGRMSGTTFLYQNGDPEDTSVLSNTDDVSVSWKPYLAEMAGLGVNHFGGTIFEVLFINEDKTGDTLVSTDTREKIEGYLAHKYQMENLLESGNTYENAPPRAAVGK